MFLLIVSVLFSAVVSSCNPGTSDMVDSMAENSGITEVHFEDNPTAIEYYHAENSYRFDPMPDLPEGGEYTSSISVHSNTDTNIYIRCRSFVSGDTSRYAVINSEGELLSLLPCYYDIEYNDQLKEYVPMFHVMEDHSVYYVVTPLLYTIDDPHYTIEHIDADSNLIASAILPQFGTSDFVVFDDREEPLILVDNDGSICIYDMHLNLIDTIPGSGGFLVSPKGEVLLSSGYVGQYSRLNLEERRTEAETVYTKPRNVSSDHERFFSIAESAYDIYFADRNGLWGSQAGDTEAVLLCDWTQSGLNYSGSTLEIQAILSEDTMVVKLYDPIIEQWKFGFLRRNEDGQTERIRVTLGFADACFAALDTSQTNLILNCISNFNQNNDTYFVELVDYADPLYHVETWTGSHMPTYLSPVFEEAMMNNTAADIIVSWQYVREEMQVYTRAGAFEDLSDVFSDVLLPAAVSAYTTDQGMFALPVNMRMNTLITKTSIADEDTPLALETLYNMAAGLNEGQGLFDARKDMLTETLMQVTMASFADRETGTCYYDSAAFADFVAFYESIDSYGPSRNDLWMEMEQGMLFLGTPEYVEYFRRGDILITDTAFGSINDYMAMRFLLDGEPFTIHGYPTEDGERMLMTSEYDIHLNTKSAVKGGAAEFLSYLLSDDVQTSSMVSRTSFPVTKSGLEQILEPGWYRVDLNRAAEQLGEQYYRMSMPYVCYPDLDPIDANERDYEFTEEDRDIVRRLFYETEMQSLVDTTMSAIIEEELSAYRAGVRTLVETQRILQSRLYIYVNE